MVEPTSRKLSHIALHMLMVKIDYWRRSFPMHIFDFNEHVYPITCIEQTFLAPVLMYALAWSLGAPIETHFAKTESQRAATYELIAIINSIYAVHGPAASKD